MDTTCPTPTYSKSSNCFWGSGGRLPSLHQGAAAGGPAAFTQEDETARGLVAATAGGATA